MSGIVGVTHDKKGKPIKRAPIGIKVSIGRPKGWNNMAHPSKLFEFVFQRRNEKGEMEDDGPLNKKMQELYGEKVMVGEGSNRRETIKVRKFPAILVGALPAQVIQTHGRMFRAGRVACMSKGLIRYSTVLADELGVENLDYTKLKKLAAEDEESGVAAKALKDIDVLVKNTSKSSQEVFDSWYAERSDDSGDRRPFPCTNYSCPWYGKETMDMSCAFVGEFYFRLKDDYEGGLAFIRTSSMEIVRNIQDTLLDAEVATDLLAGVEVEVRGEVKKKSYQSDGKGKTTKIFNITLNIPGKNPAEQLKNLTAPGKELLEVFIDKCNGDADAGLKKYERFVAEMRETEIDFDHGVDDSTLQKEVQNEFYDGKNDKDVPKTTPPVVSPEAKPSEDAKSPTGIASMRPGEESGSTVEDEDGVVSNEAFLEMSEDETKAFFKKVKPEEFNQMVQKAVKLPTRLRKRLIDSLKEESVLDIKKFKGARDWVNGQVPDQPEDEMIEDK